jgi:hypothetical protein
MKIIRIISFAVLVLFTTGTISAQALYEPRSSFGIMGGVNFQNLNGEFNGDGLDNDLIVGFHVGINYQIPIAPEFLFEPGLLFTTKGAEGEFGPITGTMNLSYLELPLNFVYKGLLGTGYVLVGFGPYVAYGIMGNVELESGSVSVDSDIEFKNEIDAGDPLTTIYIKPFDAGANIFAGYEMASGLFLRLNAHLGLLNIQPEDNRVPDNELELRNTGFGLSLGYRF